MSRRAVSPRGFTLIEAAICAVIVGIMGVAAGSAAAAAGRSREELRTRAQANAAADRLMAEVLGKAFDDPQSPGAIAGLDAGEVKRDRLTYDDIDDYDGLELDPIDDPRGNALAASTMKATVEVVSMDAGSFERAPDRTGLAFVRVQVLTGERVIAERTAYRARHAEASQ
jgi:prepilin-type N-terminal cleavage/methylation domain-containing protein